MYQNKMNREKVISNIKLSGLITTLLLVSACGGGEDSSEANAIGIQDVAIAYVKRPTPRDNMNNVQSNDLRIPAMFNEGGDLYLQERATASANTINVTRRLTNGLGDVKDVSASYDGTKLLFSLRLADPDPNDADIPRWYIYQYDITSDIITQLTSSAVNDGDDITPHFLPDGRIIFSSTRQKTNKTIRENESRGTFTSVDENRRNSAFKLHVRNLDGSIQQVSFNQSHDLNPVVLKDSGRVLFSRWNHMGSRNDMSLYSMNPDGTDVQLYYGAHSHNTGQVPNTAVHFYKPQEIEDGRIMAILRPFVTNFGGGDIIFIDGKNYADNTQPIWSQQGYISGTAQTVFKQNITAGSGLALSGRYNAFYPMLDGSNRYLTSWSSCRIYSITGDTNSNIIPCSLASPAQLNDPNVTEAPPSYGIYIVDGNSNTQVPLIKAENDTIFSEIVMAYSKKIPPIIFDKVPGVSEGFDDVYANQGIGVLHIRSVYDFDNSFSAYGATLPVVDNEMNPVVIDTPAEIANPKNTTADQRPARFIRIIKAVSLPDRTVVDLANSAFGISTQQGMREIVGYAPIEPDGSVKIKIPANVPLTISVLDKDGRRISDRHQYWFQVKPGETLECIGCHVHDTANLANNKPHGRPDYASTFNQATTSAKYTNSVDTLQAIMGETMAETRSRINDCTPNPSPCDVMKPSTNLIYNDVWTDDVAANRSVDTSFTIDYSGTPVSPVSIAAANINAPGSVSAATACNNNDYDGSLASFTYCRIIINYKEHIEPIWTTTNNRPNGSCVSCHNQASNAAAIMNPANNPSSYQLELVSNIASDTPFYNSFNELTTRPTKYISDGAGGFVIEQQQLVINGVPQFNLDIDGNPTTPIMENVTRDAVIGTDGALASYFMEKMTNTELNANRSLSDFTQTVAHTGYLTASELKLISEWLDIGAQYFNNPLNPDVPVN